MAAIKPVTGPRVFCYHLEVGGPSGHFRPVLQLTLILKAGIFILFADKTDKISASQADKKRPVIPSHLTLILTYLMKTDPINLYKRHPCLTRDWLGFVANLYLKT